MKKTVPAVVSCPQCGESLPPGVDWCPRCVGESFFETDSITMPRAETDLKQVGRYRVVELLGEGGFGRVYRALETDALEREVALKVIKPGLDSRPIIERFNAERQTLVLLDHPNIARVLDAGETDDGRPFFVMELVDGLPLNEFIRTESPLLETRLRLFLQICAAVEHAHTKGVIHRDLKPGNILVTWPDGTKGEAKATVIDFGISKALFSETAPHTGTLGARLVLGTPEYMSPEQAGNGGAGVDTRSDVFSLGALLFELITGAPPLEAEQLRRAPLEDVLRLIREQDPPRPSGRMSPADHSLHRVADELDWVVLKALAKERERRYQTARELGEEVRRFLEQDTVLARPPSIPYLAQKFVRRHRTGVAAALVAVLSLAAVAVLSVLNARREKHTSAQMRRTFSESDTITAHDRAREGRFAEAVALLCRALRTEPGNQSARMRLLTLLSQPPVGMPDAPALDEADLIDAASFLPPDGARILTRSQVGQTLSIWEAERGDTRRLHELRAGGAIQSHVVSADGTLVAAGTNMGRGFIWRTEDGAAICPPLLASDINGSVRCCGFSPDGSFFYAGGHTPLLRAFSLPEGRQLWTLKYESPLTSLAVSPAGNCIAAGCENGTLLLLDPASGEVKADVSVQKRPLGWLHFDENGNVLLAGGGGTVTRMIDPRNGRLISEGPDYWTALRSLALHKGGSYLAYGADDLSVHLCRRGGQIMSTRAFDEQVSRLIFGPSKNELNLFVGTSGARSMVAMLEGRYLRETAPPLQFESAVRDIAAHPLLPRMAVSTDSRSVEIFDIRSRQMQQAHLSAGGRIHTAFFIPDSPHVVALREDGTVRRWNRQTRQPDEPGGPISTPCDPLASFTHAGNIMAVLSVNAPYAVTFVDTEQWKVLLSTECTPADYLVVLSPGGRMAAVADRTGGVRVFDIHAAKQVDEWKCPQGPARALGITDDGSVVITSHGPQTRVSSGNAALVFYDRTAKARRVVHPDGGQTLYSIQISSDNQTATTGGTGHLIHVWDLSTGGSPEYTLAHDNAGRTGSMAAFSPDSRQVISGRSLDRRLRVWDASSGVQLGVPLAHGQDVRRWGISADGSVVVTHDSIQTVSFWHLGERMPVASDVRDLRYLVNVDVTPDGTLTLAARSLGEIHLWPLPPSSAAPLPDCFLRFAEGFGRWHVNDDNTFESVPFTAFDAARREVLALTDDIGGRQTAWMKWLAGDPDERSAWPE
ncbi:MAG: serine/threonine-protein kinase [Prosthecobacter sp.]